MTYLRNILVIILMATAACGDDDASSGSDDCPSLDGATQAQVEEAFGREADHIEEYGSGIDDSHYWYFGDDDQVIVGFEGEGGEVNQYAWHDGDEFMQGRAECPLSRPGPNHPAKFNIEDGD